MEIRSLRYFVAIVECGSISRASRSLFVAQPALSHHVAALEEELETQLLYRSPRGVTPTPAGEVLYRSASTIVQQVNRIPAQIKQHSAVVSGRVSIGIPTSTAEVLAIPLLQAIAARFPSINLDIDSNSSSHLLEWLESGRLDFSLLFITDPIKPIVASPLVSEDLCLVSSSTCDNLPHRTESITDIPLADIRALPLVLPPPMNGLRQVIDAAFEKAAIAPNIVAELGTLQTLKLAVRQGVAGTILPLSALPDDWPSEGFCVRRVVEPAIVRTVTLCTNTDMPLSLAAQTVRTEIIRLVQQMCVENSWAGYVHLPANLSPPTLTT